MPDNWQITEYEPEHARTIIKMNERSQEAWIKKGDIDKWCLACKTGGPAYTLIVEDVPVVCAGVILNEWGRAEAWSLLSNAFYKHKIKAYRAIKAGLDSIVIENKLTRIQATVDSNSPEAIDFIECLGFEYEGRLRQYGPNREDYLMFSRIS